MKAFLGILAVLILVSIGYAAYTFVKQDPPEVIIDVVTSQDPPPPLPQGELAPLEAPDGFVATIYSRETPGARVMTRDQKGTLLVSLTSAGKIVALPDLNSDGVADETRTVLQGLNEPHGILVVCTDTGFESADQDACTLYVAETGALKSYTYDADTFTVGEGEELAVLPTEGVGHSTRTLLLHPNGRDLLIAVGSSCNVCEEKDAHRAAILSYDLVDKEIATFATGLRNTVFMAIDPVTGKVWGTDNGRDMIGDDIPPDEVNIIEAGRSYGWPYCYGDNVYDTDFNREAESICTTMTSPHIALQAHSAALGLAFVPEEGWPEEMRNDLLIAYHGSWNRSTPTGYKVVRFDLEEEGARAAVGGPVDFLSGFLKGTNTDAAIGRPAGVLAEPGGVVFVSDDRAGAVYRIVYTGR